jgi:AraC-like DNA-binding protein
VHGPDEIERRQEIFREMILLNPSDNLGIRAKLLAEYFVDRRLEDVRLLLDRFPDDGLTAMVFGRPLLALVETIEATDYQMPEVDFSDPEHFLLLRKRLPATFRRALGLLEEAVRKNPSVALFSLEHGLMEVEIPDQMLLDGPFEAVEYLHEWGPVWLASGLPIFLLQSYVSPKLLKRIKTKESFRAELRDIQEQLDEAVGESWIEEFLDAGPGES